MQTRYLLSRKVCGGVLRCRSSIAVTQEASLPSESSSAENIFESFDLSFRNRTTREIGRALAVLSICSNQTFSRNSLKIFNASRSVIGESMINRLGTVGIYNHFVVPANIQSLQPVFNHLWLSHVGGMVLATLETCNSKEEAELNYNRLLSAISLTSQIKTQSKFMQMKFACIFPMNTLIELTKLDKEQRVTFMELAAEFLSGDKDTTDLAQFGFDSITLEYVVKGLEYMRVIGQKLEEAEIMMMIDAEYTYTNDALSMLTKSFALAKNRHKPLIWNTYQCFLKVTFDRLKEDMKFYRKHDIHFGAKIVKGAYMVPEREYSDKHSLPYPVHDSYEQTNHAYDTIMAWLMDEAIQVGKTRFMLASHNQNAVETCINRMEKLGVDKNDKLIMFGQQYGMCDHVSFALGNAEYPVFKSIAVGTVSETLPYLSRRAQENTSVMQNSTQERAILRGQLFKRLNPFR